MLETCLSLQSYDLLAYGIRGVNDIYTTIKKYNFVYMWFRDHYKQRVLVIMIGCENGQKVDLLIKMMEGDEEQTPKQRDF